jgi:glutamate racemase
MPPLDSAQDFFAPPPLNSLMESFSQPVSMDAPIGIFDSGVGGLSVLRAIRSQLPRESILYLGDQIHVPYGPRPLREVRTFSHAITRFLLVKGAKLIVVACNTASAVALMHLRQEFPDVPFVGMEPAVKPAAEQTRSGVVGVLATPATFQGALYASVLERFAQGVTVLQDTCPGLVQQIEDGDLKGAKTEAILRKALLPMLARGIDTIVLGCTHYPFVIPLIEQIVGKDVRVIDPAPAVARQVSRLLETKGELRLAEIEPSLKYYTTANARALQDGLPHFLGQTSQVNELTWLDDKLEE